ncbi:MAG: Chromate resistance protein ChrB [Actinoallomurus sp.]
MTEKRTPAPAETTRPIEPVTWLILVYKVPSEPTRLRATVWRRLKTLGAIYLQNSVAALPAGPMAERALRSLRKEITESMDGKATLLSSSALVGGGDLVAEYNAARDDDYEEIVDRCQDFHRGLAKEVDAGHFTYGELEENEEDLAKLRGWYEKVKARDVLGASGAQAVETALEGCELAIQDFVARVYEADDAGH